MSAAPKNRASTYESTWELECTMRSLRTQRDAVDYELYKLDRRIAEVEAKLEKRRRRRE